MLQFSLKVPAGSGHVPPPPSPGAGLAGAGLPGVVGAGAAGGGVTVGTGMTITGGAMGADTGFTGARSAGSSSVMVWQAANVRPMRTAEHAMRVRIETPSTGT